MDIVTVKRDTSPLPFSPLTWFEIQERHDDVLQRLGSRAALAIEHDDMRYLTDDGRPLVAEYREWGRASGIRSGRIKAEVTQ